MRPNCSECTSTVDTGLQFVAGFQSARREGEGPRTGRPPSCVTLFFCPGQKDLKVDGVALFGARTHGGYRKYIVAARSMSSREMIPRWFSAADGGDGANRLADVARKTRAKVRAVAQAHFAQNGFTPPSSNSIPRAPAVRWRIVSKESASTATDQDLVRNASQKGFVGQFVQGEVGGEDDEQLEGDVDFSAGAKGKEIDAAIERHDPAVEQIAR